MKQDKVVHVYLTRADYERLRKLAFDERESMSALMVKGLKMLLDGMGKKGNENDGEHGDD